MADQFLRQTLAYLTRNEAAHDLHLWLYGCFRAGRLHENTDRGRALAGREKIGATLPILSEEELLWQRK
jgi:hypothetical protein